MNAKKLLKSINGGSSIEYMRSQPNKENTVAICHNKTHYGNMSENIIRKHKCLEKNCPYLEKTDHIYWLKREEKKLKKRLDKTTKNLKDALKRSDYEYVGETIARLFFNP